MKGFRISGSWLVFLGAVCWSLNAPFVKFLTVDPVLICALRSVITALTLAPFVRPKQLRWNGWMVLYLVCYAALCLITIASLSMTSAPVAIGMQYMAVVWIFLLNWIITKKFRRDAFVPVCIILAGVVLFMCSGTDKASTMGNMLALTEGVFFAGMTICVKKAAGTNPIGLTALGNAFAAIVGFSLFPSRIGMIPSLTGLDWIIMLIFGTVQAGGGYVLYNLGVTKVTASRASVLAMWEMILGPIWVLLFLGEAPSPIVWAGFAVIIAGMLLDARVHARDDAQAAAVL